MSTKPFDLALLFTGHMVDLPGRPVPRFPAEAEAAVWRAIRTAVENARNRARGSMIGISSGARGGDLLFQEACRLFGIERRMVLPFPPEPFVQRSVTGIPNGGWEKRFWENWESLSQTEREVMLPAMDESGFALCNRRMIEMAQALAPVMQVIALWDGAAGDGPSGTAEHIQAIRRAGGQAEILDMKALQADSGLV